jgi:hypothetical protein
MLKATALGASRLPNSGGNLWLDGSLGFEPREAYLRTKIVRLQAGRLVKPSWPGGGIRALPRLRLVPWHSHYN